MRGAGIVLLTVAMGLSPALGDEPKQRPAGPINLDFELGNLGGVPDGWHFSEWSREKGYTVALTADGVSRGERCVTIWASRPNNGFGGVKQSIDATAYRGKRIRFSAAVRTDASGSNKTQLWLRVDRRKKKVGFFDNMGNRPITGSSDWNRYEIEGEVSRDAVSINFGALLAGTGQTWVDDARLEIVGE